MFDTEDSDSRERAIALVLSGERNVQVGPEDVVYILQLLEDPDPERRRAGVILLSLRDDPAYNSLLLNMVLDREPRVSAEAVEVLAAAPERTRDFLFSYIILPAPGLTAASVRVLERMGASELVDDLIPLFASPRDEVRDAASRAVAVLTDPGDPRLVAAASDPDPLIRATVLTTLARYDEPLLIPVILQGFGDPDARVVQAAQFAILNFGDTALPPLHNLLYDRDPDLRRASFRVVEGLKSPRSLPVLKDFIDHPDQWFRNAVRRLMVRYGEEAVPWVADHMSDIFADRAATAELLEEIGGEQALDYLEELLDDPSEDVREVARRAFQAEGLRVVPRLDRLADGDGRWSSPWAFARLRDLGVRTLLIPDGDSDIDRDRLKRLLTDSTAAETEAYLNEQAWMSRDARQDYLLM